MPTIIRQEDPAYFKIVGTVLTLSDDLVASLVGTGRDQWPAAQYGNTTSSPLNIARVPWVASDNPNATEKVLHLRAVLSCDDSGETAQLTVTSTNSGQDLVIYNAPGNTFATNSTDPVVVESNVDLFANATNVFDPTVDDILVVVLRASGVATAQCDYAEFLLTPAT